MPHLVLTIGSSVLLVAGLVWLYLGIAASSSRLSFSAEWWEHFSPERYLPLQRLLASDDLDYLRSMPGYSREIERVFRRGRLKICGQYLAEIEVDFQRLMGVGQALVTAGRADARLADELFRQRMRFVGALWRVRLELVAYRFGLGRVNVSGLIEALDQTAMTFQPMLNAAA